MKLSNAMEAWLTAMQQLLAPHFATTTNRIDFAALDNEWEYHGEGQVIESRVTMVDGHFKHQHSARLF